MINIIQSRSFLSAGGDSVSNQWQSSRDDGTVRVDPLDGFNKYRGGFDITNEHYWTSTAFTGIYGYAIAAFWLLAALSYAAFKLIVALLCCKCRRRIKPRQEHDRTVNENTKLQPSPLLNRNSTIGGQIVASGVAIGGSVKFHDKARKAVDIIIHTADDASETIYNATSAMTGISRTLVVTAGDQSPTAVAAASASAFLASTSRRLDAEAASIQKEARDNERLIRLALTVVYVITVVAVSVNLAVALALSVCGILRIRKAISWLFWLCWLLMIISWFLFGIYYFLQNFAKDTCNALEKFEQDPYSSTLSSLVPCDALESAKPILNEVSEGIYDIVSRINDAVSSVPSSITNNVQICSPFSPPPNYRYRAYNADNCPPSSIPIGGIPKLLEQYLSETDYRVVEGYASSIQSLVDAYPGMESLAECESVRVSLSRIVSRHCRPLKKNVAISWAALVALSSLDLVLLLLVVVGKRMAYSSRNTAVEDHESAADFPPPAGLRRSASSEERAVG
ncbi:hypothetical protein LINGRAHAP2_LOCUS33366 [Linum grandiflorum]